MNIVRCVHCGEITDFEKRQICGGCGEPLSAEPTGRRPRQISPVQREASADIDYSKGILIAIVAAAGLGAALIFFRDYGFMGALLAIGLAIALLIPILKFMKSGGTATPDVAAEAAPAGSKAGALPPAAGAPGRKAAPKLAARHSYTGPDKSALSSFEKGCGMVLKIVGIFVAVVVGLAALGILVLWIACMSSGGMKF